MVVEKLTTYVTKNIICRAGINNMKTVVVFDTEDERGMKATVKIIDHLSKEYLAESPIRTGRIVTYKKIEFIKMLREYASMVEKGNATAGLRDTKAYADAIFEERGKLVSTPEGGSSSWVP